MEELNPQLVLEDDSRQAPGGKPWAVEVDVYLEADTDPPRFRIESSLPIDTTKPDEPLLVFENNGRPGFEIRFYLYDLTEKGYRFPRDPDDAVWSTIGEDGCPTSEAHEVFKPIRVTQPNGTMLVVENDNSERNGGPIGKFRYTLNVTRTGSKPFLPLDPGGDDRDGPRILNFR